MQVSFLRWSFVGILILLVVGANFIGPTSLGVSATWENGDYHFSAGTQPWAIAFSIVIFGLYLWLVLDEPATLGKPLPGVFRRLVAFWIDFMLAMLAIAPIVGILPTLTEWKRTGVFAWSFERTTPASGDGLLTVVTVGATFLALLFFFAWPLLRNRPSPGACVLGYQIVPEDGTVMTLRIAVLRTLLGFVAAAACYLAPFVGRDREKGKFWLDQVFATRAVKLG